jgi:hypothetical protein
MRIPFALLAIIAAAFTVVTVAAQAAPIAPPKGVTAPSGQVIQTAGGCGRYRHRNWRGHCVRN